MINTWWLLPALVLPYIIGNSVGFRMGFRRGADWVAYQYLTHFAQEHGQAHDVILGSVARDEPHGQVMVAGRSFPVTRLQLAEGGMLVTFRVAGPTEPMSGAITVFGEDGQGCWQGRIMEIPALPPHQIWECHYRLSLREVDGAGTEILPYHLEE